MASIIPIHSAARFAVTIVLATGCRGDNANTQDSGSAESTTLISEGSASTEIESASSSSETTSVVDSSSTTTPIGETSSTTDNPTLPDVPRGPCANYRSVITEGWLYGQADVDATQGVECVMGLLRIHVEDRSDPLADLMPLSAMQEVGGLSVNGLGALTSLQGLDNLKTIQDVLVLGYFAPGAKQCTFNPVLENLDGLSGVETVGGDIDICGAGQDALISIDGLDAALEGDVASIVRLTQLRVLESVGALAGVTRLSGGLVLNELPALVDLTGMSDVESATSILIRQTAVSDLAGLEALTTVDSRITITDNPQLLTLAGLGALEAADELIISNNPLLPQAEAEAFAESVIASYVAVCGNLDGPPC